MGRTGIAVFLLVGVGRVVLAQASSGVCFRSPEDAVRSGARAGAPDLGYRVQSMRWDALLGRGWATVLSCRHPDRPAVTIDVTNIAPGPAMGPLPPAAAAVANGGHGAASPMVWAGDVVRVFRRDEFTKLEFSGFAQASGSPGDVIRVRVKHAPSEESAADQFFTAVVRGPRLLEMQP